MLNAPNTDWEDLTMDDKGNLYIADVGNNLNERKDLCVLKLNANSAFQSDSINVEKIYFSYAGQRFFLQKPLVLNTIVRQFIGKMILCI